MREKAMNRIGRKGLTFIIVTVVSLFLSSVTAQAQLTMHDVETTDVTSAGFAVLWRTSETATPRIVIFEDPEATVEVTSELEVTLFPLIGGNPEAPDEFSRLEGMDDLRESAKTLGLMKIRVHGCLPQTSYYFRVSSDNGIENVQWPESGLASVTTIKENAFVLDSKQILITLTDNSGTVDFHGWLMTASTDETIYPVSTYVGDGCDTNQAYLDLNNLFDMDEDNWTPTGLQVVTLEVRMPQEALIQRGLTVFYSDTFHVSNVNATEINIDEAGDETPPEVSPSLPGGTYSEAQSITLNADEEAYIFFTTDATDPTTDSPPYADPVYIDQTTTLKFMAIDMAGNQSAVESELYTIVYNQPPFEPSLPDPSHGATGVSIETALGWQGGDPDLADVVSYNVFLGLSDTSLALICGDQTALSCRPGSLLEFNTPYYWQVVATDDHGAETIGPVWQFTTFAHDGDEDSDGLSNEKEISWGTDPFAWDSDRDGYSDGEEVGVGTNPLDRTSRPPYPPKFGDIDGDWDIDGADLSLLVSAFGSNAGEANYLDEADFNSDGRIDEVDLDMFSRVLGYAFSVQYDPASDFDDDGDVDGADLAHLVSALGSQEGDPSWDQNADADLNGDDRVDRWDVALFSINYGCIDG